MPIQSLCLLVASLNICKLSSSPLVGYAAFPFLFCQVFVSQPPNAATSALALRAINLYELSKHIHERLTRLMLSAADLGWASKFVWFVSLCFCSARAAASSGGRSGSLLRIFPSLSYTSIFFCMVNSSWNCLTLSQYCFQVLAVSP